LLAEHTGLNAKSVEAPTNSNTTETWLGVAKGTIKQIPPDLKQRKMNHAHTPSNALTAKKTISWMTPNALSGNTDSTENSTQRKRKSSEKPEPIQFAQA